jgi:hypothetical protein
MSNGLADEKLAGPAVTEIDISKLGFKKIRTGWLRQELALFVLSFAFYVGIMSAVGFPVLGIQLPDVVGLALAVLVACYLLFLLVRLVGRALGGAQALGRTGAGARSALIPHFGVTLAEAKSRLQQHFAVDKPRAKATAPPVASAKAALYTIGAVIVFLVSIVVGNIVGQGGGQFWGPVVVGTLFGLPLIWLLRRGARHAQPSAESVLASDPRPPVLLLRSFVDDSLLVDQRIKVLIDQQATVRFEEAMSAYLSAYGPFVAVGEPGQTLPQIGAARAYLTKDEWQAAVKNWIGQAGFIVMVVGATEWIRWELSQILAQSRTSELLLLLPPLPSASTSGVAGLKQRWENVLVSFAETRWHRALLKTPFERSLALHLRNDGGILAITGSGRLMQDYETASLIVLYARFCWAPS